MSSPRSVRPVWKVSLTPVGSVLIRVETFDAIDSPGAAFFDEGDLEIHIPIARCRSEFNFDLRGGSFDSRFADRDMSGPLLVPILAVDENVVVEMLSGF